MPSALTIRHIFCVEGERDQSETALRKLRGVLPLQGAPPSVRAGGGPRCRASTTATFLEELHATSPFRPGPLGPPLRVTRTAPVAPLALIPLHDISRSTLRRAYLGEVTEDHGTRLVPLNQPPGAPARVAFDRALLGLPPDAIARFWIDQRIRGQGSAPRAIPTVSLLLRVLAQLPGGISYVRRAELPANAGAVKVLTVDGKKPGDPGYLFP